MFTLHLLSHAHGPFLRPSGLVNGGQMVSFHFPPLPWKYLDIFCLVFANHLTLGITISNLSTRQWEMIFLHLAGYDLLAGRTVWTLDWLTACVPWGKKLCLEHLRWTGCNNLVATWTNQTSTVLWRCGEHFAIVFGFWLWLVQHVASWILCPDIMLSMSWYCSYWWSKDICWRMLILFLRRMM